MTTRRFAWIHIPLLSGALLLTNALYAQVGINPTGAAPHPSAGLDVEFSNRGFLLPRMSSAQRDAIVGPAEGLKIYNTDTKCENYFNGTLWYELCGVCMPQPTTPDAGPDQTDTDNQVTLSANTPTSGTAQWSIVSGTGGSIDNAGSPVSTFTGQLETTYVLRWSITTACTTLSDDVTITLQTPSKKVFLTSTTTTGNLGGLSGADNFCQTLANTANLGGTYVAWLSTPGTNAVDRVPSGVKYVRLDGVVVANDIADLTDGTLDNPILLAEDGNTYPGEYVYTGSTTAGILVTDIFPGYLSGHCNNWTCACEGANTHLAGAGISSGADFTWTNMESPVGLGCSNNLRLYCFEQ